MPSDPVGDVRIRSGQRKLIFATATRIGLRDEQLHDLVESVCDYRTRAIARITVSEARRLIGVLKTMERGGPKRLQKPAVAASTEVSDDSVKLAAQRAGRLTA